MPGCANVDSDPTEGHSVLHLRGTDAGEGFWIEIPIREDLSRWPLATVVTFLIESIEHQIKVGREVRAAAA